MHTLGAFSDADGAFALPDGFDFSHMTGLAYLAAGTSYHAGLIGRYWMEQLADLPVVTVNPHPSSDIVSHPAARSVWLWGYPNQVNRWIH